MRESQVETIGSGIEGLTGETGAFVVNTKASSSSSSSKEMTAIRHEASLHDVDDEIEAQPLISSSEQYADAGGSGHGVPALELNRILMEGAHRMDLESGAGGRG